MSGAYWRRVHSHLELFEPPYSPDIKSGTEGPFITVCFLFISLEATNQAARPVSVWRGSSYRSSYISLYHIMDYGGSLV